MASDTIVNSTSEAAILGRLIRPENGDLREAAAEAILEIRFEASDLERMHELTVKNQEDRLTRWRGLMENFRRVSFLLDLMHSKARQSLKRRKAVR